MGLRHSRPLCGSGNTTRTSNKHPVLAEHFHSVSAAIAKGKHPVPFRTRKLSPSAPMVLRGGPRGRVGRRRAYLKEAGPRKGRAASFHVRAELDMHGGPVDDFLSVAAGRPALDQLEVEVGRTLEDRE